jgi:DNA-binding LacI/PurR family transcriptional regulator
MAVTIRAVARSAEVSTSTVSRAFTSPELLSPATRQRVLEVAKRLGYAPNHAARSLVTGRTGNIGVIVPDLTNPFFTGFVKGVQAQAHKAEFSVFLGDSEENPRVEIDLARAMARQVDGVILCSSRMTSAELKEAVGKTNVVLVNRRVSGVPAVVMDWVGGMRQAIDHLAALGHRRVAYLNGPRNSWSNQERRRGLRRSVRYGMAVVEFGPFVPQFEAGVQAADLALAERLTAIAAYNDLMALGVLSRLAHRRVAVPDEVSVVGFDDIAMASMYNPSLTTVAVPQGQAGREAVDLLVNLFGDQTEDVTRELGTQLIVRGSTGTLTGQRRHIATTTPDPPTAGPTQHSDSDSGPPG